MKKFFTLNSIMLACLLSLIVCNTSFADEYKSMIRYDRVWECICILDKDGYIVLKCMKFDGQEEIDGKVYHRIVTFKKTFVTFENDSNTPIYETVDCFEPEGFMREEGGIVYTLVAVHKDETFPDAEPEYYGTPYTSVEDDLDDIICKEYELYNFNVKEDDYYSCMSFFEGVSVEYTFCVLNISTIEVAGEECRMIYVCPEFEVENHQTNDTPYYWYKPIIEGIGAVDYGCLNYHEFIDRPLQMYAHHYFCRLFDMEGGNMIYPFDNVSVPYNIDYGAFNSVDTISSSISPNDCHRYDMLGRRITTPAPGQLYIQDGKKLIAPKN